MYVFRQSLSKASSPRHLREFLAFLLCGPSLGESVGGHERTLVRTLVRSGGSVVCGDEGLGLLVVISLEVGVVKLAKAGCEATVELRGAKGREQSKRRNEGLLVIM